MEYIKVGVADRLECIELCVHSAVFIDELFCVTVSPIRVNCPRLSRTTEDQQSL